MVLELYSTLYEKVAKIPLYEKCWNFENKSNFCFWFFYGNLNICDQIVLTFQVCIFWTDWERISQGAIWLGRVGPGLAAYRLILKPTFFISMYTFFFVIFWWEMQFLVVFTGALFWLKGIVSELKMFFFSLGSLKSIFHQT